MREGKGVAVKALESAGVSLEAVRLISLTPLKPRSRRRSPGWSTTSNAR
nr:hypothetical protein [Actinospica robiniae]